MENHYVIVDGLPYLLAAGKTFGVRWDELGYTVGSEVKLASVPETVYSELSIRAKCAGKLNSIPENAPEKPKAGRKKKAVSADDTDSQ